MGRSSFFKKKKINKTIRNSGDPRGGIFGSSSQKLIDFLELKRNTSDRAQDKTHLASKQDDSNLKRDEPIFDSFKFEKTGEKLNIPIEKNMDERKTNENAKTVHTDFKHEMKGGKDANHPTTEKHKEVEKNEEMKKEKLTQTDKPDQKNDEDTNSGEDITTENYLDYLRKKLKQLAMATLNEDLKQKKFNSLGSKLLFDHFLFKIDSVRSCDSEDDSLGSPKHSEDSHRKRFSFKGELNNELIKNELIKYEIKTESKQRETEFLACSGLRSLKFIPQKSSHPANPSSPFASSPSSSFHDAANTAVGALFVEIAEESTIAAHKHELLSESGKEEKERRKMKMETEDVCFTNVERDGKWKRNADDSFLQEYLITETSLSKNFSKRNDVIYSPEMSNGAKFDPYSSSPSIHPSVVSITPSHYSEMMGDDMNEDMSGDMNGDMNGDDHGVSNFSLSPLFEKRHPSNMRNYDYGCDEHEDEDDHGYFRDGLNPFLSGKDVSSVDFLDDNKENVFGHFDDWKDA